MGINLSEAPRTPINGELIGEAEASCYRVGMNRFVFVAVAFGAVLNAASVQARPPVKTMMKLEFETRVQLRCDDHVIGELRRSRRGFHPDEVVAYAFSDPVIEKTRVHAPGAAVRGHGEWYHVAYDCQTSADGLDIQSFGYQLGEPVPRADWQEHGLVPR